MSAPSGAIRLFQVPDEIRAIGERMLAEDDDEALAALAVIEHGLLTELTVHAESVALLSEELETSAAANDEMAARFRERATRQKRRAESLRAAIQTAMERAGIDRVPGQVLTLSIQKSPPAVVETADFDLDLMPEQFVRVTRALDRSAVSTALKAGESVPGCTLAQRFSLRRKWGK